MTRETVEFPRSRIVRHRGFSIVDLLLAVGIVGVISALILATLASSRAAATSTRCLANLHMIGLAFSQYAADYDLRYPDPTAAGKSWESLLPRYLPQSMIFACPADGEIFPAVGSSYDWRDTADDSTTLAGRPLSRVVRGNAVLAFETLPGWHRHRQMNAVLVDGAAVTLDEDSCLSDLILPVDGSAKGNR